MDFGMLLLIFWCFRQFCDVLVDFANAFDAIFVFSWERDNNFLQIIAELTVLKWPKTAKGPILIESASETHYFPKKANLLESKSRRKKSFRPSN